MKAKTDIKHYLLEHYKRYPRMQIQDVVKLIFQNEFAGGHLIKNEKESLKYLQDELHTLKEKHIPGNTEKMMLFEPVGHNLFRMHLAPLKKTGISPETANRFFVGTAAKVRGSLREFEKKLMILGQCCLTHELPFSFGELDDYLRTYREKGYPPVSHSRRYREAYSPAYRVIGSKYRDYFELFRRVDVLLSSKETVTIAIDGNSGAGKSTLAALLGSVYDCNLFHMDHFFLRPHQRTVSRLQEAGGNIDYERFYTEVITGLEKETPFTYSIYDCKKEVLTESVQVSPKKLNIIEGCYSMHPVFSDPYDLRVFLQADDKTQSRRILKRNGPGLYQRFISEWIPMENRYFKEMHIRNKCDLIFEEPHTAELLCEDKK